ncbi:SRPBCC family protein [Microbaculum marinum]|uniref:SRPBCC family protein n=1 Tax=Microbaculum marinum TaxID=1764581 RepID=A0AAW9RC12_9HYPH
MLKILGVAAVVVAAAIAGVLVFAATKPDTFRLERSATIKASPDVIYSQIENFRNWRTWSPYEDLDPDLERSYGGAAQGVGAIYEWSGSEDVGAGRMEIVDAVTGRSIRIKLDFVRPFEAHNTAEFDLVPGEDATLVTWAMAGPQPYLAKVMSVFIDFDTMVGKDFETGLDNLRKATERD